MPFTSLMMRVEIVAQHVAGQPRPVGRHRVDARHAAHGDGVLVGAIVAHHADALDREEDGEGLPELVVEARAADLLRDDRVGAPQRLETLGRDLADHADREPGPRERMPPDRVLGQPEAAADLAHLVLEQLAQRLDQREAHALRAGRPRCDAS